MTTLAVDIGGANLKAATHGCAWSVPFALWREPEALPAHLAALAQRAGDVSQWLVTMTAELCDCFASKRDGVAHILDAVERAAGAAPVAVWSTSGTFVSIADARIEPLSVAAANWHALATFAARQAGDGLSLMIDTGSTTTDIIRLRDGRVDARGLTDMDRLASGELVYLGVRRTNLAAVAGSVTLHRRRYGVMGEWFADAGDVFVLRGDAPATADDHDTADGRPRTKTDAARRIARTIGADLDMLTRDDTVSLARAYAELMVERLAAGIHAVLGDESPRRVIVSGEGEHLACAAAHRACPDARVVRLADTLGPGASAAACAYAMLELWNTACRTDAPT